MIYLCADDYGICGSASANIQKCIDNGALDQISVFPNFDKIDFRKICGNKSIRISLHLNLVEGKCKADADDISLIADKSGNLKHTFGGLFMLSLFRKKEFETQAYKEIKAQVLFWKSVLPNDMPFCIDSHQHTHMIPTVFKVLLKVLKDEEIYPDHIRIPAEPLLPYLKTPSLYFTYKPVNIIKQWLLKFLWLFNKSGAKKHKISAPYFFGVLFSGNMDKKRVGKILPKYEKLAKKQGRDIEVLFHPGYTDEYGLKDKSIAFKKFYLSQDRKTEFDSVMEISERRVYE